MVLKGKSPFEVLYEKLSDYTILKAFGCLCFPLLLPKMSKLENRSTECIFIGCCADQKGYISRHVQFMEKDFPYQENKATSIFDNEFNFLL